MPCAQMLDLQEKYTRATAAYTESLDFLSAKIGTINNYEYQRLRQAADHFRKLSDRARMELERHTAEHECWNEAAAVS